MGRSRELGAISNPSMEEKASNSDSDSDSYSSSENCPVLLGQNSDRMRKLCGSLYGVSTDRPQWEQYRRSTDFLYFGAVYRNGLRRFIISGGAHWHFRRYQVTRSLVDAAPYRVPQILHFGASSFLARFKRPSSLEFHGIKCIRSNIGKTP